VHFPFGLILWFPSNRVRILDLDPEDPKIKINLFPWQMKAPESWWSLWGIVFFRGGT
jgi:hypothetical protein